MTKQEPDAAKKPLPTPNDEARRLVLAAQLNTVLSVAEIAAERELEQAKAALDSTIQKRPLIELTRRGVRVARRKYVADAECRTLALMSQAA